MKKLRQGRKTMGIPLTQGQVAIVDTADWWWLSEYKWCASWKPSTQSYYAVTNSGPKGKRALMHREIMKAQKGEQVDHKNHKTLDNRKSENLRLCTGSQNSCNRRTPSTNTSGVKGVSWRGDREKWQVYIKIKGNRYHVGLFDSLKEAAKARRKAAKKFHKEFAHD